jgi:predicted nucleic acid-binding protein
LRPLVLDATPLIYLCKIGYASMFAEFPERKVTTPRVVGEVVGRGKELGAADAFAVEELIQRGIIEVTTLKDKGLMEKLMKISDLHPAEAEVLALAKEMDGTAITDEGIARRVARVYVIRAHGTAYLLMRLIYQGRISRNAAKRAVDKMISAGWYLAAEDYAKLMKMLEMG